jgi:hypothetical protein
LVALASGLDPLSDQLAATLAGEVDDAGDERLADVVVVDLANEPDVELNEVWPELEDVTEAGKAGAGIIHGDAYPGSQALDRSPEGAVVLDRDMLGDLEDDRTDRAAEALPQADALEEQGRRGVQTQPAVSRQAGRSGDRRGQARGLELQAEADRIRVGEPAIPAASGSTG